MVGGLFTKPNVLNELILAPPKLNGLREVLHSINLNSKRDKWALPLCNGSIRVRANEIRNKDSTK